VVEPDNPALLRRIEEAQAMRQSGRPTLPSSLAGECGANPFLRIDAPAVRAAIVGHTGRPIPSRVEAFAALRHWKDGFRA
jgi:hydroxyacylglutathione hydrolase